MTTRKGNEYHPVLCDIKIFPMSGKSVVVTPYETTCHTGHVLPYKGQCVMLQRPDINGNLRQPQEPSELTSPQRADYLEAPFVIAWVQGWLLEKFKSEGREITLMTPPAPLKDSPWISTKDIDNGLR